VDLSERFLEEIEAIDDLRTAMRPTARAASDRRGGGEAIEERAARSGAWEARAGGTMKHRKEPR